MVVVAQGVWIGEEQRKHKLGKSCLMDNPVRREDCPVRDGDELSGLNSIPCRGENTEGRTGGERTAHSLT